MTIYNFSAGPAVLPKTVLTQAAAEMLDWHGSGMSVMEMSHRGPEFDSIIRAAQSDLRELLRIPDNYHVLFMQGGGLAENAIVPLNLARRADTADFVVTGSWSAKSAKEAARYLGVNIAASAADAGFVSIPELDTWTLSERPAYVHLCTNETIHGVEFSAPDHLARQVEATTGAPVVADMSSHILSRPVDVSAFGVIFAGAQKNIGPAGLTIVIVREDLAGQALQICPSAFDWKQVAANDSMYNTPPTYGIYIAGLVFRWLLDQGGLPAIEAANRRKADLLYDYLDATSFYTTRVLPEARSRMNVPFYLQEDALQTEFLAQAKMHGLLQLKGHKTAGGLRASIYNAMPYEGVAALVEFLREFERSHG